MTCCVMMLLDRHRSTLHSFFLPKKRKNEGDVIHDSEPKDTRDPKSTRSTHYKKSQSSLSFFVCDDKMAVGETKVFSICSICTQPSIIESSTLHAYTVHALIFNRQREIMRNGERKRQNGDHSSLVTCRRQTMKLGSRDLVCDGACTKSLGVLY
jgi:hypothetical protein